MTSQLRRVRLLGLDFVSASSVVPIVDALLDGVRSAADQIPVVVTPNVDHVVKLRRTTDAIAQRIASSSAVVLPDGQPIVWASRLLGCPLAARLPGSTLVRELWPRLIAGGRRTLVVATSATVAHRVESDSPAARAIVAPMLDLADRPNFDRFVNRCAEVAIAHDAELVFVTLGFPKQCNIIAGMLDRWPADRRPPTFLAVGASFDMLFGVVRRAPVWMQRAGLEWSFRFLLEPRRLFRRYFVDDIAFFGIVWRERRARRTSDESLVRR